MLIATAVLALPLLCSAGPPKTLHPVDGGKVGFVSGKSAGNEEVIRAEGFVKRSGNRLEVRRLLFCRAQN